MSKYPSLLPDDLSSNEYIAADGTKYTMTASSLYNGEPHYPYQFFSYPPTYEYMDVYKYVGFTNVPLIYALKYVLSSREGAYTYHPSASYTFNELTYHSPGYVDESTSKVPSYNPVASFLVRLISLDDF